MGVSQRVPKPCGKKYDVKRSKQPEKAKGKLNKKNQIEDQKNEKENATPKKYQETRKGKYGIANVNMERPKKGPKKAATKYHQKYKPKYKRGRDNNRKPNTNKPYYNSNGNIVYPVPKPTVCKHLSTKPVKMKKPKKKPVFKKTHLPSHERKRIKKPFSSKADKTSEKEILEIYIPKTKKRTQGKQISSLQHFAFNTKIKRPVKRKVKKCASQIVYRLPKIGKTNKKPIPKNKKKARKRKQKKSEGVKYSESVRQTPKAKKGKRKTLKKKKKILAVKTPSVLSQNRKRIKKHLSVKTKRKNMSKKKSSKKVPEINLPKPPVQAKKRKPKKALRRRKKISAIKKPGLSSQNRKRIKKHLSAKTKRKNVSKKKSTKKVRVINLPKPPVQAKKRKPKKVLRRRKKISAIKKPGLSSQNRKRIKKHLSAKTKKKRMPKKKAKEAHEIFLPKPPVQAKKKPKKVLKKKKKVSAIKKPGLSTQNRKRIKKHLSVKTKKRRMPEKKSKEVHEIYMPKLPGQKTKKSLLKHFAITRKTAKRSESGRGNSKSASTIVYHVPKVLKLYKRPRISAIRKRKTYVRVKRQTNKKKRVGAVIVKRKRGRKKPKARKRKHKPIVKKRKKKVMAKKKYIPRGGGRKPKINKYKRKRPAQKRKNKKVYKKKVLPRNVRKTIKKPLTKTEKRNKIEQIFLPHVTLPKKKSARFFVYNSYKGKGENVEQTVYQLPPPPKTGPSDRSVLSAVNKIVNARNNFGRLLTKRKKVERHSVNRRKKWLKRKKPALMRKAISKVNKKKKAKVVRPVTKRVKRKTPAVVKKAWRKIHKKRKAKALRRKLPKRKQQSAKLVLKTTDGHGLDMCEKSETDIPQEVKNLDPHTQFVYKLVTRLPVESKVIVMGKINSKPFKKLLQTVDIIKKCDEIDFAQTSFKSNSYDLLIYNHTLYGQDFQTLILEANRLIKNGGQLAIIDVYSDQDNEKQFLQSMADAGFLLIRQNIANKTTWEYVFEKKKRVAKSVYLQPFTLAVAKYRRPIDHFK